MKIPMRELGGKTSLLTRGTADQVLSQLGLIRLDHNSPIVVDFRDVVAVTPSFLDQFLGGLKRKISLYHSTPISLRLLEVPTHASEKFAAVGRSHKMVLHEMSEDEWLLVESVE